MTLSLAGSLDDPFAAAGMRGKQSRAGRFECVRVTDTVPQRTHRCDAWFPNGSARIQAKGQCLKTLQ